MSKATTKDYAFALDLVEKRRADGLMTEGEAIVWRQRLLAEMATLTKKPRPAWAWILIGLVYVMLWIVGSRILTAIILAIVH